MQAGPLVAALAGAAALGGVIFAFSQGASPYADVAQARRMSGRTVHLPGSIDQATVSFMGGQGVSFDLVDESRARMPVKFRGAPPANLNEASQVVAIGAVSAEGVMEAEKLLVKCPSKYEAEEGAQASSGAPAKS
jgi:cytochrome c-type biogenesis protein CcmE